MRLACLAICTAACVNTTGGHRVTYDVAAQGADVPNHTITTALGWTVVLTKATLHLGAVYLNLSVPNPEVTAGTACILPGVYTGEELASLDVDVLSTTPQPFPARAEGTDDEAHTGEVWLTGGDINALDDRTLIADVAGTATKGALAVPFTGQVTIGANRYNASSDPANPSAHPICRERIVAPIDIDFRPHQGGTLLVTVDPTLWFAIVDFSTLPETPVGSGNFAFPDDNSIPASLDFYNNLRSANGTFVFAFE